jgi:pimeloyl-ACP methyl ester carboxylesterase
MATYLLVHGAWGGGYGYRDIAVRLRAEGHDVHIASLTGLGDRVHLVSPAIDLTTHVNDVLAVIDGEKLIDFILVGHSYGGMIITAVSALRAAKIRSLVYIDAFLPRDGEALWDVATEWERKHYIDSQRDMPGLMAPFPGSPPILTRHPLLTVLQPYRASGEEGQIKRRTYIYATRDAPTVFTQFHDRVSADPAWKSCTLDTGHIVMMDDPDGLTAILLEEANSR